MDHSQTSMYVSLRQLVWSAVVGVLSFQVIAPTVWGYVNSILGIPFYQGYITFALIYALTLLIITGIWLLYNRQPLQQCLTGNVTLCRTFLTGLTVSILIQVVATSFFLTQYQISKTAFVALQVIMFVLNIALLVISIWITVGRIKTFSNGTHDKRVLAIRDAAVRIITGSVAVVMVLITFACFHWHHNQTRYYTGTEASMLAGFTYFDQSKQLDSLVAVTRYQADTFNIPTIQDAVNKAKAAIQITPPNNAGTNETQHYPKTSPEKKETVNQGNVSVTSNTTIVHTQQTTSGQGQQNRAAKTSLSDRYKKYADLLAQKKDLTLRIGQKQVGKLLRDHQIKLTYLFINVFILLIALFLFFRTDYLIKEYLWKEADQASTLYPGTFEFKAATLKANETQRLPLRLVSDIWLYLTIAVWLLVPLFKPVEDDKINAAAPFKALTFSAPGAPWQWFNNPNVDVTVKTENTVLVTDQGLQLIIELHADMAELNTLLTKISDNTQLIVDGNKQLIDNTREIIQTNNALIGKSDILINRCDNLIEQCDTLIDNTDIIKDRIK